MRLDNSDITALVEGAVDGSRAHLTYAEIEGFKIPRNARSLSIGKAFMPFYATFDAHNPLKNIKVIPRIAKNYSGGLNLDGRMLGGSAYVLDAFKFPRAILTSDGRFFLNIFLLRDVRDTYFNILPAVLEDCTDVFSDMSSVDFINSYRQRNAKSE